MQDPILTILGILDTNMTATCSKHAGIFDSFITMDQVCVGYPMWEGVVRTVNHTKEIWTGDCLIEIWANTKASLWILVEDVMNSIDINRKAPGNGLKQIKNKGLEERTQYSDAKEKAQVPPPFGQMITIGIVWERTIIV